MTINFLLKIYLSFFRYHLVKHAWKSPVEICNPKNKKQAALKWIISKPLVARVLVICGFRDLANLLSDTKYIPDISPKWNPQIIEIQIIRGWWYSKFPNKGAGCVGKPLRALPLERGKFHLPVAFYRLEIGPLLAEIWPKKSRNPVGLGPNGGRLYRGRRLYWRIYSISIKMISQQDTPKVSYTMVDRRIHWI